MSTIDSAELMNRAEAHVRANPGIEAIPLAVALDTTARRIARLMRDDARFNGYGGKNNPYKWFVDQQPSELRTLALTSGVVISAPTTEPAPTTLTQAITALRDPMVELIMGTVRTEVERITDEEISTFNFRDVAWPAQGDGLLFGYNVMVRQAREASYKAAASFDAAEMNGKRTEIAAMVQEGLQAALDKETGKGWFVITNVIVRNVTPDKALEISIQNAAKMEFEIDQKKKQKLLADEEAKRLKAEAQGVADANKIISDSLTPQLLRMREIEAQSKFAGQGTHTVVLGGSGTTPLINLK